MLRANRTLTELELRETEEAALGPVAAALESNTTLKCLGALCGLTIRD